MIEPPSPSRPWSAFLRTGQGVPVKVPHFVGACPNCGGPARANLGTVPAPRVAVRLDIVCEGGCGLDEKVVVDLNPVAREVA